MLRREKQSSIHQFGWEFVTYLGSYFEYFIMNGWDSSDYKHNLLFLLGEKKKKEVVFLIITL